MFDIDAVIRDSIKAASDVVGSDIQKNSGFLRSQFEALARNAAGIAADTAAGKLTKDEAAILLKRLPKLTEATLHTFVGLQIITVEKAWNAVADVLQKAVGAAIGGIAP